MTTAKNRKKKARTKSDEGAAQGPQRVAPGIYRANILTTYVEHLGDILSLTWALDVQGPLGARGGLLKRSRIESSEDGLALRRELAVLGVNLVTWRGLDLVHGQLANRQAFVEVLPCALAGEDRVHILQRATTHDCALPDDWTLTDAEMIAREAELDFSFDTTPMMAELYAAGE